MPSHPSQRPKNPRKKRVNNLIDYGARRLDNGKPVAGESRLPEPVGCGRAGAAGSSPAAILIDLIDLNAERRARGIYLARWILTLTAGGQTRADTGVVSVRDGDPRNRAIRPKE